MAISETPKFYITIDRDIAEARKLMAPISFARSHKNDIGTKMSLSLRNGPTWEIGAKWNKGGCFWLLEDKEWSKFAHYYLLKEGDVVVFSFNGNSRFSITIFDETQSEIDYPKKEIVRGPISPSPKFYIQVDKQTTESKKIVLPRSFLRKHRPEISAIVNLSLPKSLIWEMVVVSDGFGLTFEAEEFINFYSLVEGVLLVFCYVGDSTFLVTIFDENRLEVDYPLRDIAIGSPPPHFTQPEPSTAKKKTYSSPHHFAQHGSSAAAATKKTMAGSPPPHFTQPEPSTAKKKSNSSPHHFAQHGSSATAATKKTMAGSSPHFTQPESSAARKRKMTGSPRSFTQLDMSSADPDLLAFFNGIE